MPQIISDQQKTESYLDKLKGRIKAAANIVNKIILIPRDKSRFACKNPYHGKMAVSIDMHKMEEFECECGLIYKKERI